MLDLELKQLGDAMDCIRWKSKIKGVTVTSGVVRDGCKL